MRSRSMHLGLIFAVVGAWLLSGCTKSITSTDRYAVTKLQPGTALLFFLDSQSDEKSSKMEARVARTMFRALEEANAGVQVVTSKEFCPDVVEPFYSPEDILLLLQEAQFKQRITANRIEYIVIVYVRGHRGDWVTRTHSDPGGFAVYNKRETEHYTKATIIDAENTETAGALVEQCSASAGYGFGVGIASSSSGGFCCAFPFAWYGGETEDLAIRSLAASVAKFLMDKDATPNSKRPGGELKVAAVPPEPPARHPEEEPNVAAVAPEPKPEEVNERIKLRDKGEKNFTDQDLQKMISERNFFNKPLNPDGNFPNAFVANEDGTVTDKVTGLMWQKAGSPSEMTFDAAGKYVQELNSNRFGGHGDWRLPTLEELCSLLEGTQNQYRKFMDNLFDPAPYICWSVDENQHYIQASYRVAFCVNFARGEIIAGWAERVAPHHSTNVTQTRYYVRAVRTAESEGSALFRNCVG
jgi:Protein of unknown function (DUF1566)